MAITEFITKLDLSDVTIAGESIGGILPITVSLKIPNRIKKLLCFNPYDYDTKFAEGIRRGNFFANFILFHVGLPIIGSFFSMLENKFILKNILAGGFVDKSKLPRRLSKSSNLNHQKKRLYISFYKRTIKLSNVDQL